MIPPIEIIAGGHPTLHCVYSIDVNEHIVFVGCCRLDQVHELPDANRNTEFWKHVQPDQKVNLTILSVTTHKDIALNAQEAFIIVHQPHCNVNGKQIPANARKTRAVRCMTDGRIFRNQAEACEIMGLKPAALSRHLNKKRSHRTVRGHKFEYEDRI